MVPVKYSYENGGLCKAKNQLRAMPHSPELNLIIEYLHEHEFIFQAALAHE
jgi:hypothetical protein